LINEQSTTNATILLVDNGSTRVDAAVQLRRIAHQLSGKTGLKVHAVSLKHSDRITLKDIESKLGGIPARVFQEFMTEHLTAGERDFILLPLFFGKSRALTSFVPDEKLKLESQFGSFDLNITEVLYPLPQGDSSLVEILYEHVISTTNDSTKDTYKNLVLVDHGSPLPAVNAVRQHIASALDAKLPDGISIDQAAMERRQGKEFDFNGELLEDYLSRLAESGETHATVLLLFLLAGTHAGENGDIIQICNAVMKKHPKFNVSISPLIGQNANLIACLAQRLNSFIN
jgi:sirohydrochlorin ferrochelatase